MVQIQLVMPSSLTLTSPLLTMLLLDRLGPLLREPLSGAAPTPPWLLERGIGGAARDAESGMLLYDMESREVDNKHRVDDAGCGLHNTFHHQRSDPEPHIGT